eukprot:587675_1
MAQSNMLEDLEPDIEQRLAWKVGSKLYIYCDTKEGFVLGVINAINMDRGKEWLEVRYHIDGGVTQMKLVERYGERIKPYEHDIMVFIEANKNDLFEAKQSNGHARVERIKFVSKVHAKWMMMTENASEGMEIDIRDVIESDLNPSYNLSSFLSDYRVISQLNRDVLLDDDDLDEKMVCNASQCMILDRNARDREYLKNNNAKRRALYFVHDTSSE